MSQFDVHRNPSLASRASVPYVVNVQSGLLEALPTRLTIPLGTVSSLSGLEPKSLCPRLVFEGEQLCALPHLSAAFRVKDLGRAVGSLSAHSHKLVGAIDAVLSGV